MGFPTGVKRHSSSHPKGECAQGTLRHRPRRDPVGRLSWEYTLPATERSKHTLKNAALRHPKGHSSKVLGEPGEREGRLGMWPLRDCWTYSLKHHTLHTNTSSVSSLAWPLSGARLVSPPCHLACAKCLLHSGLAGGCLQLLSRPSSPHLGPCEGK